jgi:phosphoadenosine phosphosulfate reductase
MSGNAISEWNTLSAAEAAEISERWERLELEEVLEEAAALFEDRQIGLMSAFGPGSLVVIHVAHAIGLRLPVIFIDTLHHFPETLELVERVRERYSIDLRVARAADSREEFEALHGERLWETDLDRYQRLSKVEPCERVTADFGALIIGRRRTQAQTRSDLPLVQGGIRVRVNPLAGWSRDEVWEFILRHDVPYNALHDLGFTSIGDAPLTTPIRAGEHERAGRWRGLDRLECGIHGT